MKWITSLFGFAQRRTFVDSAQEMASWRPPSGWAPYCSHISGEVCPPIDADILIIRDGWDRPLRTSRRDMHPAMCVNGLYWVPFSDDALDKCLDELPIHKVRLGSANWRGVNKTGQNRENYPPQPKLGL